MASVEIVNHHAKLVIRVSKNVPLAEKNYYYIKVLVYHPALINMKLIIKL
jgi:hypothetical protein